MNIEKWIIAEHSIARSIAAGRPDAEDEAIFRVRCRLRLSWDVPPIRLRLLWRSQVK